MDLMNLVLKRPSVNFPASANWMLVAAPFYTKLHLPCWCINLAKRVTFKLPRRTKEGRGDFKVYAFLHSSSSSQELFLLKTCITEASSISHLLKLKTRF